MKLSVAKRYERLLEKIQKAHIEITELQKQCKHPTIHLTPKSSGGWEDTTEYWYNIACKDCGHTNISEQDDRLLATLYPESKFLTWCKYSEKWK